MKAVVEALLGRFRFVPAHQLHFARNVAKRLDEHRELVEAISEHTSLLDDREWHVGHLAAQDDYLMRLYYLVNREWPCGDERRMQELRARFGHVRPRPSILGVCALPELPARFKPDLSHVKEMHRPNKAQEGDS